MSTRKITETQTSAEAIQLLPITAVRESAENVRTFFDEEKLEQLKADIAANGQREPVTVRAVEGQDGFELIDGARRYRCIKALMEEGHANAPMFIEARVKEIGSEFEAIFARLSSFNREELSPIDEARAYFKLRGILEKECVADAVGYMAKRLGVSVRHVEQRMALLDLAAPVLEDLAAGIITVSHADELARLPEARQVSALMACVRDGLSVRGLKDWLRLQGWTKTAEREAHGEGGDDEGGRQKAEGRGDGADSDARGHAGASQGGADGGGPDGDDDGDRVGSSADGDEAEAEDVIEEAQADMDRQKNAAAVAEAKRAENDTTPDAETAEGQENTEESKLRDATRAAIAYRAVRSVKDVSFAKIATSVLAFHVSQFRDFGTKPAVVERIRKDFYYGLTDPITTLGEAAAAILAINFQDAITKNYPQSFFDLYVNELGIDVAECELDARAEMLGITVAELRKQEEAKKKPARADKGKARPSPKVAKKARAEKVSALQIKKNVAATKKAKGKGKKK
jgi:ParB/RepB/Spo0J family partition protein